MSATTNLNRQKSVLITGASGGIGYELAKLFARDGYNLVLVARSQDKLAQVADELKSKFCVSVKVIAKDLASQSAPDEIFHELQQESIKVHILVNNAGFATYGLFAETELKGELQMMQVNMVCLTHLTKLFLPGMIEQGEGKILNVASTAAFQPGPLMAVYYASKAYVLSFSEAIANELQDTGVTVTVLCPGATETGFQQRADMEASKLFKGRGVMDAETVAKIGYRGLMNNETVVIPGLKNQLLAQAVRFTPRKMVTKIARKVQERVD